MNIINIQLIYTCQHHFWSYDRMTGWNVYIIVCVIILSLGYHFSIMQCFLLLHPLGCVPAGNFSMYIKTTSVLSAFILAVVYVDNFFLILFIYEALVASCFELCLNIQTHYSDIWPLQQPFNILPLNVYL